MGAAARVGMEQAGELGRSHRSPDAHDEGLGVLRGTTMSKTQMMEQAKQLEASADWIARMAGRKMLEALDGGPSFEGWTWADRKRHAMKWLAEGAAQEARR